MASAAAAAAKVNAHTWPTNQTEPVTAIDQCTDPNPNRTVSQPIVRRSDGIQPRPAIPVRISATSATFSAPNTAPNSTVDTPALPSTATSGVISSAASGGNGTYQRPSCEVRSWVDGGWTRSSRPSKKAAARSGKDASCGVAKLPKAATEIRCTPRATANAPPASRPSRRHPPAAGGPARGASGIGCGGWGRRGRGMSGPAAGPAGLCSDVDGLMAHRSVAHPGATPAPVHRDVPSGAGDQPAASRSARSPRKASVASGVSGWNGPPRTSR
jgi:hypothetical protein